MLQEEVEVECPFCGESFSIVVDTSVETQSYIEDCYVCCRPIQFNVHCAGNGDEDEEKAVSVDVSRA